MNESVLVVKLWERLLRARRPEMDVQNAETIAGCLDQSAEVLKRNFTPKAERWYGSLEAPTKQVIRFGTVTEVLEDLYEHCLNHRHCDEYQECLGLTAWSMERAASMIRHLMEVKDKIT